MPNLLRSLSLFNRPIRKNRQFMHQSPAGEKHSARLMILSLSTMPGSRFQNPTLKN